jgi:hypothetical protein
MTPRKKRVIKKSVKAWAVMQHKKIVEWLPGKIGDMFVCSRKERAFALAAINADKSGKSTYYTRRVTITWSEK